MLKLLFGVLKCCKRLGLFFEATMGILYISSCFDKDSSDDGIIECIPEEEACSLIPAIFNPFAQKVETGSRHTGASRLTHPILS